MLQTLPPEVLHQIITHLPSASAITNLSLVNREFHDIVAADDYAIFRPFVRQYFPSIQVPPLWRDAARVLTSRSRAWDRWAFIARECRPPPDSLSERFELGSGQKYGYIPAIDSYESWHGSSWNDKTEVVCWSAAGRLRTRISKKGLVKWVSLKGSDDHLPQNDILDVRLLRPHQREKLDREVVVFRRANGRIAKAELLPGNDSFESQSDFVVNNPNIDSIDISCNSNPLLAAINAQSICLYPVKSAETEIRSISSVPFESPFAHRHRKRCAKFLTDDKLVVGIQFVEGRDRAPIQIYDVSQNGLSRAPLTVSSSFSATNHSWRGRHCSNAIIPLNNISSKPGDTFLSGWTDGVARLYDCRTPLSAVAEYVDAVDDGQILSLLAIGQERFLAGSHQNACLKTFDLRMPGAKVYSYLNAQMNINDEHNAAVKSTLPDREQDRREINIFLAINFGQHGPRRRNSPRQGRYSSSIYNLSSPSPSSPTIYAGIENHVIQLDFVSTDDITGRKSGLIDPLLDIEKEKSNPIFNISCYERPRTGRESTDTIKLRNQMSWSDVTRLNQESDFRTKWQIEPGWDDRWRLAALDWENERGQDWRSARRR